MRRTMPRPPRSEGRRYDPALLWIRFHAWAEPQVHLRLQLHIFRRSQTGAYYLPGPKLYWDAVTTDGHFGDCDQGELAENADDLAEVIAYGMKGAASGQIVAQTYEEFCELIGLQ